MTTNPYEVTVTYSKNILNVDIHPQPIVVDTKYIKPVWGTLERIMNSYKTKLTGKPKVAEIKQAIEQELAKFTTLNMIIPQETPPHGDLTNRIERREMPYDTSKW